MFLHAVALLIFYQARMILATGTCVFNSKDQWQQSIEYKHACTEEGLVNNKFEFALCIAQRNTLNKIFQCADASPNRVLFWRVDSGSDLDSMDLIPDDTFAMSNSQHSVADYDFDDDGQLEMTPRGILWLISLLPKCQTCGMTEAIERCPYESLPEFLSCLCCECVSTKKLRCLDECIFGYRRFAHSEAYGTSDSICDNYGYCDLETYPEKELQCEIDDLSKRYTQEHGIAAYSKSASTSCTSQLYRVSDGYRTTICADDSHTSVMTRVGTTTPWSKASAAPVPSITITSDTRGVQTVTDMTPGTDSGAAQTADPNSPSATIPASGRSSGINKKIYTFRSLIALSLAIGVFNRVV